MKAAFIERAGILYKRPKERVPLTGIEFYSFVTESLSYLSDAGYLLVILHNGQPDAGRSVNKILSDKLEYKIRRLAFGRMAFYACFHPPDEKCNCRMPGIGMISAAVDEYEIDLKESIFFVASPSGLEAAQRAGVGIIAVINTGYRNWRKPKDSPVLRFSNLEKAVKWLKKNGR